MPGRGLALVCCAAVIAVAATQELNLPGGPVKRLASPDGSKILYSVPYEKSGTVPQLWIEDKSAQRRTKLFDIASTLSAAWSADGSAFYVNDHSASDTERAYIYDSATLKRLDIAARILAQDAASRPLANDHAYFEVSGWEGTQDVAVAFFGHTTRPVVCFHFRYDISRAGVVKKRSQRATPATETLCDESSP
jgi:hypothetical protein